MHHYEFCCRACNRPFSKIPDSYRTPNEGKVVCPHAVAAKKLNTEGSTVGAERSA
jgi:hypothetical protein